MERPFAEGAEPQCEERLDPKLKDLPTDPEPLPELKQNQKLKTQTDPDAQEPPGVQGPQDTVRAPSFGAIVRLRGLTAAADLNGLLGVVGHPGDDPLHGDRLRVYLLESGEVKAIRPQNLSVEGHAGTLADDEEVDFEDKPGWLLWALSATR